MALTLEQIRSLPGYEGMGDDDIVKHGQSIGMEIADAPKLPEESGSIRSYVGIPLLKGTADIGSAVGYGLEAVGAKEAGQALQESGHQLQETLTQRQSKAAQEDAKKTIIDENGNYGGYNLGTLVQDVATSAPGTLAMGVAGAPLAKGVTAASKILGVGEKAAKIAGSGTLGKALAAGLDTAAGNAVGFGAAEGAYSGASNAAQLQHEIRNADINKLSEHPAFVEAYHKETDPSLPPEQRLYQARDVIAAKAASDVFADTFIKTGGISALTGGGMFGMIRDNVVKKVAGEATEGVLKSAGKGFLKEGVLQEAPQSGLEQLTTNQAKRDYTDQNQGLNEGVWNAAAQGGISGGVLGLAGGAGGSSQTNRGNQNGIDTQASSTPLSGQQAQPQTGSGAAPMPNAGAQPGQQQPSGQAGGANSQSGFDVAANPHEAYQKRAELKKRLTDAKQALKAGEDVDGNGAQDLAGIEAEYNAIDAGLIEWEKNSEEGKAHRKESLEIKKNAAAGDIVTHPAHGEVKITNAGRTSATISTLDDQPLGEAPYHALRGLRKPQPRTEYDDVIKAAADKHGVPVEFLKAVALQESGAKQFDEDGKTVKPGTSNALGIMQIIPKWHPEFDQERLANNAEYNINAGAQFLSDLIKKHGGDLHKAAQSYYGNKDAAANQKYADEVLDRMGGTNQGGNSGEQSKYVSGAAAQGSSDVSSDNIAGKGKAESDESGVSVGVGRRESASDDSQIAEAGNGEVVGEISARDKQDSGQIQITGRAADGESYQDGASPEVSAQNDVSESIHIQAETQAETEAAASGFSATHELSDGTQVTHVEGNTYKDANGDEYQDDYAEPIKQTSEPVGGNDRLESVPASGSVGGNDSGVHAKKSGEATTATTVQHPEPHPVTQTELDAAAHEAALSPHNDLPEPTAAQKEAGNYKKGHVKLHGFDIAIENPKGSKRSGTDSDGKPWSVDMAHHYGYIKRSTGADNEHVDVFVGDHHDSDKAYVVNQIDPKTGKFDEHKVMLGFDNKTKAKVGYLKNYAKGWKGFGSITEIPVSELKSSIESGAIKKPIRNATTETHQGVDLVWNRGRKEPTTIRVPANINIDNLKEGDHVDVEIDTDSRGVFNKGVAPAGLLKTLLAEKQKTESTKVKTHDQSTNQAAQKTAQKITETNVTRETNNPIPTIQPEPQNPNPNPAQPVAPSAQNDLAGKAAKPVAKKNSTINDNDDLLAAIAKIGGLSRDEAKSQGIDPAAFGKRGYGIKRVFTKSGKSYDEIAELLRGHHFDVPMANDLVDKVSRAINQDEKFYNPAGHEKFMELQAQERFNDEEAKLALDIESKLEDGDIDLTDIDDALEEYDDDFDQGTILTGKELDDFWGIDGTDESAGSKGTEVHQEETLGSYTESEIAGRAADEKQRAKQEESDRVKTEQKAKADRDRDSLVDDFMGTSPKTGDVFGMSDPLENINKSHDPSKNTVFTEDAAEKARAILRKKLGQLNSGIDPELMQAGITLAGYHIEKGARSFAAYSMAMLDDLGDVVKPYLKSWYMAVKYDPRATGFDGMDDAGAVEKFELKDLEKGNAPSTDANLESDSGNAESEKRGNEPAISDERSETDRDTGPASRGTETEGERAGGNSRPAIDVALTGRKRGNKPVHSTERPALSSELAPGVDDSERGGNDSNTGIQAESAPSATVKALAEQGSRKAAAATRRVIPSDPDNIAATLPMLNDGQKADVLFAENRLSGHKGVLFTNGTGTGKTFSGLGIAKRLYLQGKKNILIVVPSINIADQWAKAAQKFFDLNVNLLESTREAGKGPVITTYANFGMNQSLVSRDWDLVIADEAHKLMQSENGDTTDALKTLRGITYHRNGFFPWFDSKYSDVVQALRSARSNYEAFSKDDSMDQLYFAAKSAYDKAQTKYNETRKAAESEYDALSNTKDPKVVFLSATPFAYVKAIDYAEGYLFEYGTDRSGAAYNSGDNQDQFFMQHFGYRMRYNKLTRPDANVDTGIMERQFNTTLRRTGALSFRSLDVNFDYDRKFILVESAIGRRIDEAMEWIREQKYQLLADELKEKFDHLQRRYLLEAIKAQEVIPVIKQHLALGRKVLVFHDYKKGGAVNPFIFSSHGDNELAGQIADFNEKFGDLAKSFKSIPSPINAFKAEFGDDVMIYNGDVSAKERIKFASQFNDDNSGKNLILVQSASAKEGVSFHDTTGKHQRVLLNIGLPTQPTTAIQQEGRIYRVGQQSDALFRYINTGTNWERWAFASTIAQRASTAENLAAGEGARALKDAFIDAFEESDAYPAGHEGEGKGGKSADKAAASVLSEFDRAKSMYFGQQKKTSRTKSAEGTDYYATPEPVGLKMVEIADIRPGESILEPSAGHGAIARWFRDDAKKTAVEPSGEMGSRLALVFDGDIRREQFEDLNIINKYDAIVMNPPFGSGGKTAIEHLAKAAKHLRMNGRIVALIPEGPSADKRFDTWMESDEAKGFYLAANIRLPSATFDRAGTGVKTRIVVIDKVIEADANNVQQQDRDYSNAENIKELFERIENLSIRPRNVQEQIEGTRPESWRDQVAKADSAAKQAEKAAQESGAIAESADKASFELKGDKILTDAPAVQVTTKKGKVLDGVFVPDEDTAKAVDQFTYQANGRGNGWFVRLRHIERPAGGVKFSRSQSTRQAYEQRIDELFDGATPTIVDGVKVLDRSDALDMLGYGDYETVLAEKHAIGDGIYNHGLTREDWKKVPEWLDDPVAVFKRDDGHMTFIAPETKNGQPIVIGLKPGIGDQTKGDRKLHLVLTAFNKDKGKLPFQRMIKEGNLLYVNTRKSPGFKRDSGHLLPSSADEFRGSKQKIHTERDLVKYRKGKEAGGLPSKNSNANTGSTVDDVKSWLPKRVKALLDAGKLRVEQSAVDVPQTATAIDAGGVEGFYDEKDDTLYLIADNLTQENLQSVLAHELLHRAEAIDPQIKAAINRFENHLDRSFKHAAAGRGSEIEKAAYRRVIDAETPVADQAAEYRAYLVSEYSKRPDSFKGIIKKVIEDFIAAIRAALYRAGVPLKSLKPADLAALAKYGAKVNKNSTGSNGTLRSTRNWKDDYEQLLKDGLIEEIDYGNLPGLAEPYGSGNDRTDSGASEGADARTASDSRSNAERDFRRLTGWAPQEAFTINGEIPLMHHRAHVDFDTFDDARRGKNTGRPFARLGHFFATVDIGREEYGPHILRTYLRAKPGEVKRLTLDEMVDLGDKSDDYIEHYRKHLIEQGYKVVAVPQADTYIALQAADTKIVPRVRFSRVPNPVRESAMKKAGLIRDNDTRTLLEKAHDWITSKQHQWKTTGKDRFKEGVFDKLHGIYAAERDLLGNLSAEQSGYVAARLSTGGSSVMYGLLLKGAPKWDATVTQLEKVANSKGLTDIFAPVAKDMESFFGWMIGNRAARLMAEGRENNFTADEIRELIAMGQGKEDLFKSVRDEYNDFKKHVLDAAEEAGLIDPAKRLTWDQGDYIPFYRVMDDDGTTKGPRNKRGFSHQASGIRQLKGGTAALGDPLENIVRNFAHLIDASIKNNAIRKVANNFDGTGIMEEIPRIQYTKALVPMVQFRKLLIEQEAERMMAAGMDHEEAMSIAESIIDQLPQDALEGYREMWTIEPPSDPDVVRVMDEGRTHYYRVNEPALLRGLTGINQRNNNEILKMMRGFKRVLTTGVTADPTFMMRNFIRDAAHAWTINEDGFKFGIDSVNGALKSLREQGGSIDMMFSGASFIGGYINGNDPEAMASAIRRALAKKGLTGRQADSYMKTVALKAEDLWDRYRHVGDQIENANREAVYAAALKAGKSKTQALFESKDLMDYSMQGNFAAVQLLADVLPFFNARLQGLYKLGRVGLTRKQIIHKALLMAGISLALLAANWDDDRYEELEDWDKDTNWHIFFGGEHIRIPKPFEVGYMFGTVPERMMRNLGGKEDTKKSAERLLWMLGETFAMNPTPQIVKPGLEVWGNKDTFTHRPIENMSDEGKLPSARYDGHTSDTMRWVSSYIGDATGLSPKRLEHLWRGYLGSLGMYVLTASDAAFRYAQGKDVVRESIEAIDIPVLRAFATPDVQHNTRYKTELYDMASEVEQIYRTINVKKKEGDWDSARELMRDKAGQLQYRKMLSDGTKALKELRAQMNGAYRNPRLTPAERKERIDALTQRGNDIAKRIVTSIE